MVACGGGEKAPSGGSSPHPPSSRSPGGGARPKGRGKPRAGGRPQGGALGVGDRLQEVSTARLPSSVFRLPSRCCGLRSALFAGSAPFPLRFLFPPSRQISRRPDEVLRNDTVRMTLRVVSQCVDTGRAAFKEDH